MLFFNLAGTSPYKGGDESNFLCLACLDINGVKLKKSAHTVYRTQYHMVSITRYIRKILIKGIKKYMKVKLPGVRKDYPDWERIEIGIDSDHVHLYIVIPLKYSVSNVVETIKKNMRKSLREKFDFLKKVYWDGKGIWGKGYFVSTVGINGGIIWSSPKILSVEEFELRSLSF